MDTLQSLRNTFYGVAMRGEGDDNLIQDGKETKRHRAREKQELVPLKRVRVARRERRSSCLHHDGAASIENRARSATILTRYAPKEADTEKVSQLDGGQELASEVASDAWQGL